MRMNTYIQLTGHCEAAEGNRFGVSAPGGEAQPVLPKIHIASLWK